ncbi:MAG: exodeoxyribonuclease VII large subunit [Dysgonamonadaceae bacterium]|jgi:exodeoxyribonuclease VII large subunit|nr:exodeoxyribonuclease VII large subunit [Dysgonamonadaceae bacterium]
MDYLSLSQLNTQISETIGNVFYGNYWVLAETSDVRQNDNGHCYLEFIEKNLSHGSVVAKARGYIWANVFSVLAPLFEQKTGRRFESGLKVLVNVSVEFHPLYGYGLNVLDIDPAYTLGDLQTKRQEILRRLKEDGIMTLNRDLKIPQLIQHIAVVSSATAAGYEDFVSQLSSNSSGFVFYPCLFPAVMQGEQTEKSIIDALDKIFPYKDLFDVVVIIRGGGATSDLSPFDSYMLAANCVQFPLPIITGIGHERDDTVLDFVAFHRAKTPTAVADYLIEKMENIAQELSELQENIYRNAALLLENASMRLSIMLSQLPVAAGRLLESSKSELDLLGLEISNNVKHWISALDADLNGKFSFFRLSSPKYILAKGYSITRKDGKSLKSVASLQSGDIVETVLAEGTIRSKILNMGKF